MVYSVQNREADVIKFVDEEIIRFPKASLIDLYKNYFQDAYGPGHLIFDKTSAGAYLDWELKQPDWGDTVLCQPLGINHDFFRIHLLLLKNGTIPRDVLLAGTVKSSRLARKPKIKAWKEEWDMVLQVIKNHQPDLPDLNLDEKQIAQTLSKGEVAMHHSKLYAETYHPHYRIIHRSIFEQWLNEYALKL